MYHFDHPDSKVHGAKMGPIWDRQDPGVSHVGPMNFVIWDGLFVTCLQTWTHKIHGKDVFFNLLLPNGIWKFHLTLWINYYYRELSSVAANVIINLKPEYLEITKSYQHNGCWWPGSFCLKVIGNHSRVNRPLSTTHFRFPGMGVTKWNPC